MQYNLTESLGFSSTQAYNSRQALASACRLLFLWNTLRIDQGNKCSGALSLLLAVTMMLREWKSLDQAGITEKR